MVALYHGKKQIFMVRTSSMHKADENANLEAAKDLMITLNEMFSQELITVGDIYKHRDEILVKETGREIRASRKAKRFCRSCQESYESQA